MQVERRAVGVAADCWLPYDRQVFYLSNMSSLLALVCAAVHEYQATGTISSNIAFALCNVRVALHVNATVEDLRQWNYADNMDQHQRKRHSELDNLFCVRQWKAWLWV